MLGNSWGEPYCSSGRVLLLLLKLCTWSSFNSIAFVEYRLAWPRRLFFLCCVTCSINWPPACWSSSDRRKAYCFFSAPLWAVKFLNKVCFFGRPWLYNGGKLPDTEYRYLILLSRPSSSCACRSGFYRNSVAPEGHSSSTNTGFIRSGDSQSLRRRMDVPED